MSKADKQELTNGGFMQRPFDPGAYKHKHMQKNTGSNFFGGTISNVEIDKLCIDRVENPPQVLYRFAALYGR